MTTNFDYKSAAVAFALVMPICLALWVLAVPSTLSVATFTALTLVLVGATMVGLNTWNNGRATRSIAHVLNDAEKAAPRE